MTVRRRIVRRGATLPAARPQPVDERARLRRVFELELEHGCANSAVVGGLDGMLVRLVEAGMPTGLLAEVRRLPPAGYRSLAVEGRETWLRGVLGVLSTESAAPREALAPRLPLPTARARGGTAGAGEGGRIAVRGERQLPSRDSGLGTGKAKERSRDSGLGTQDPVTSLPGIGRGVAQKLEKLGIRTAADAVFLFPRRFNDFRDVRPIARLEASSTPQTVVGRVESVRETRFGRRTRGSEAVVGDTTGHLRVTWFNMPYVARGLHVGDEVVLSGRVRMYRGRLHLENPEYEPLDEDARAGRLVPVYPGTAGVSQRVLRGAVRAAVAALVERVPDPIPAWLSGERGLAPIAGAIRTYHAPDNPGDAEVARQRLALGEFLAVQAAVLIRRAQWLEVSGAPVLTLGPWQGPFLESLPFRLTQAQERVWAEVSSDIARTAPMLRLLQGDVGSGKTVVAFAAMLAAVQSGYQAALMAPTEILAEQHYRSLARALGGEETSALDGLFMPPWAGRPLRALLLTGSLTAAQKERLRADAANGGADIVIGTHALLEDSVALPRLGLAVVDEQHRFGVAQRTRLREKGHNPHLLVMTATPIPRTLALTVYGDLESSVIDELPPGRQPIETHWVHPSEREGMYGFIRERLDAGERAYVICPLVEDSEALDVVSAQAEFERLRAGPLCGYAVELLHGRMTGREKDETMRRFGSGRAQVLVSTSVVEVGVDVAEATVIVIEGAERFGLSQLHQFRGRVGRSARKSYCLLFSSEEEPGPEARQRLEAMEASTDGFALAEVDLEMRGEGEAWGRVQSGQNTMLRVARLTDRDLLVEAREMARAVLARDPWLQKPEHRALAAAARPILEDGEEAN